MDTEKLRELEQEMRQGIDWAGGMNIERTHAQWADRLRDIIAAQPPKAELGQEVGAVTNEMVLAAADAFLMHPGCVDQTVGHGPIRAALEAALTSPAHTSEAKDAAVAKYLPTGSTIFGDQDYETTKPCFEVVHRGVRYYMSPASKQSIARLNEQDAAMRQEGGNG